MRKIMEMGIEWLRINGMPVSELSRLTDHLTCVAANAMELGAFTVYFYLMQSREVLYEIIEKVTGHRLTVNYVRIGGLARDVYDGFEEDVRKAFVTVRGYISDVDKLLTRNRIYHDRVRDVSVISQEDAISLGFTGPCLRSTGVNYDVRKAHPYLVYDRIDFDIPLGAKGDNYDRYVVRIEEMRQSMRIVEQALKQMPQGPINISDPRIILPPKKEVYGSIEGL
jgi:NADH-quinone oxidoreductase subunit D